MFLVNLKVSQLFGNRLSLFCERSLCRKPYDESGSEDYVKSSLRKWLNTEFYNNAFSKTEKTIIKKSNRQIIQTIDNPKQMKIVTQKQEIQDYVSLLYLRDALLMYGKESEHYIYAETLLKGNPQYETVDYYDAFWVINPKVNLGYFKNKKLIVEYEDAWADDPFIEASVHPFIEITL